MSGLKLNELVAGEIYRCRLTHLNVMVLDSYAYQYDTPRYGIIHSWYLRAIQYNPISGRIEEINIHENQLEKI